MAPPEPARLCPLCGAESPWFGCAGPRNLFACGHCDLRFVPPTEHVSAAAEAARYCLHQNTPDNAGYVRWLSNAVAALQRHAARLGPNRRVLDFGSGPTPVLVSLLRQPGFDAVGYDPHFAPDTDLTQPFDAIVSIETFEHFRNPREDIGRVAGLLVPGGVLVVMTALHDGVPDMSRWHYALDETHIAFYSMRTFQFIAGQWGLSLVENDGRNVVVLAK